MNAFDTKANTLTQPAEPIPLIFSRSKNRPLTCLLIGMINPEKIWTLIAHKMAGHPLDEELSELEQWLNQDPELENYLKTIIHCWQPGQYDKDIVKQAFRKVSEKLTPFRSARQEDKRQAARNHEKTIHQVLSRVFQKGKAIACFWLL